jgi:hypothetical protein
VTRPRATPPEKAPATGIARLRSKHAVRVAAEQSVVAILTTAKASLWSLRQLRLGLRQGRKALIDRWGKSARSAWYRGVKEVTGHKVTEIKDLRQVEIKDWRGPR